MKIATLVLEDGTRIEGQAFGAETEAVFELVFNTSMTGYQEILTDPSYRGQGVLFTASHIGNVGINLDDDELVKPQVSAAVIRSLSPKVSNASFDTLGLKERITAAETCGFADSSSSKLMPTFPMCETVNNTPCPR